MEKIVDHGQSQTQLQLKTNINKKKIHLPLLASTPASPRNGQKHEAAHIYRDNHVHVFDPNVGLGTISSMAVGTDIILIVYSQYDMVIFKRHGYQISPLILDNNRRDIITCDVKGKIKYVCYNNHINSFLITYHLDDTLTWEIVILEIAPI